jgi:hypothetical protein
MRFSGHETFPCRYSWLPKAYSTLSPTGYGPCGIAADDEAMERLGLGKNMVRALRFWLQAMGVAEPRGDGGFELTAFGQAVLGAHDPYLEDRRTLWLLHWKLSTNADPICAWDTLLNRWQYPEVSRNEAVRAFRREAEQQNRRLSDATLGQHFDIFLHTYVPTRGVKGDVLEDNLDCPLVELELLQPIGERRMGPSGKREPVYAFRRERKPDITAEVFSHCLAEFASRRAERTLSFREIAVGHGSVGHVFKLPEDDLLDRLERIERDSGGRFEYRESAALPQVIVHPAGEHDFLAAVYAA